MRGNDTYNQIVSEFDNNEFVAVGFIVSLAKKLAAKYDYLLLDSEVISWLLTGEQPPVLGKVQKLRKQAEDRKKALLTDILNYVDDKDIKASVLESVAESTRCQNLVYIYTEVNDKPRQARVHILTRLIWYSMHQYYTKE